MRNNKRRLSKEEVEKMVWGITPKKEIDPMAYIQIRRVVFSLLAGNSSETFQRIAYNVPGFRISTVLTVLYWMVVSGEIRVYMDSKLDPLVQDILEVSFSLPPAMSNVYPEVLSS